ncbi:MAG: hypothetical protein E7254_07710 [Lachnospiraceae bacterium]|nr:hypothetical protein [Lachnospiraceae bacterium]
MKKEELKLTFELVPKTSWFSNLHNGMLDNQWIKLSDALRNKSGGVCKICGRNVGIKGLDAHETWEYVDGLQILKEINAICKKCHSVKHFGYYAIVLGKYDEVFEWFKIVNELDDEEAVKLKDDFLFEHKIRSMTNWKTIIVNEVIKNIIEEDVVLKPNQDIDVVQKRDDIKR